MSRTSGALPRLRWRALLTAAVVAGTTIAFAGPAAGSAAAGSPDSASPAAVAAEPTQATPQIVPAPVSMTTGQGTFTVTRHTASWRPARR